MNALMAVETEQITPQITHAVVFVTPEMARRWIGTNEKNRKTRDPRILKYREDMEAGRWTFTGDPIQFGSDGKLQNGQHRLLAVAGSRIDGVPFMVIRGLPPEAKKVMDQGAKRTAGDQLTMLGHANANNLASAVKVYLTWERGYLFRDNKIVGAEIGAPAIEQWVTDNNYHVDGYQLVCSALRRTEASPAVGGAAFFIFEHINRVDAIAFSEMLARGAGHEGDPTNTLHQRLRRISRNNQKVPTRDVLALFIQAWNAYRDGRPIFALPRPRGGSWTSATFPVAR